MAQFETWLKNDLKTPNRMQTLRGDLFTQDNQANLIGVVVTNDGQPVTLNGSVTGVIIRADGGYKTVSGQKEANRAWIILPAEAYAVVGQIQIVVRLVDGSNKIVLGACTGYVTPSQTSSPIIDPGTVVPNIDELLAYIDAMIEGTDNANAAAQSANDAAEKIDGMTVSATEANNMDVHLSTVDGHYHLAFDLKKGDKGDPGTNATIVGQETEYQVSDSGTVVPSSWVPSQPIVPQGYYLWVKNTISWSTGQTTTVYTVARQGIDGTGSVSSVMGASPDATGNVPSLPDYTGATENANGVHGLVPAAQSAERGYFLRGDGVWDSPSGTTYSDATPQLHGLMSAVDKGKLDAIAAEANKTIVDDALDGTSANPVENQVVTGALALKAPLASPVFTGTPTSPTPGVGDSTDKIATTMFVDLATSNERPLLVSFSIGTSDWTQDANQYAYEYTNTDIVSGMAIIGAALGDSLSEGYLLSGLLLTLSVGSLHVATQRVPTDTISLTVSLQKSRGGSLPVYITPRGAGGVAPYSAHGQLIVDTVALINYSETLNFAAIFEDSVVLVFDGEFNQASINTFASVPNGYEPFTTEIVSGFTWYNGTQNSNDVSVSKNGGVSLNNIACERIQFMALYKRKLPVMRAVFYRTGSSGGPSSLTYNVNEIVADTASGTVTYRLDVTCPSYTLPSTSPAFGLYIPNGYSPTGYTLGHTVFRLSDGTTVEDNATEYLYINRGGTGLQTSVSGISVVGFVYEATSYLFDENMATFPINRRVFANAVATNNKIVYSSSNNKLTYKLDMTFTARTLDTSTTLFAGLPTRFYVTNATISATVNKSNGTTATITLRMAYGGNITATSSVSNVTGLHINATVTVS